jgi:hypothetical protein
VLPLRCSLVAALTVAALALAPSGPDASHAATAPSAHPSGICLGCAASGPLTPLGRHARALCGRDAGARRR